MVNVSSRSDLIPCGYTAAGSSIKNHVVVMNESHGPILSLGQVAGEQEQAVVEIDEASSRGGHSAPRDWAHGFPLLSLGTNFGQLQQTRASDRLTVCRAALVYRYKSCRGRRTVGRSQSSPAVQ